MCSRTAGVMTTLMRNGRDRRSGKPVKGQAILERALLVGTRSADHIRASGHNGCIAMGQASTRKQAGYMAAPERFAKRQIYLAPRAPSIHGPNISYIHCGAGPGGHPSHLTATAEVLLRADLSIGGAGGSYVCRG